MLLDLSIYNSRKTHEKPIPRPLNTINTIKYYINTLKELDNLRKNGILTVIVSNDIEIYYKKIKATRLIFSCFLLYHI